MKLSDFAVKKAQPRDKIYKMFDGGGLFLQVEPKGGKYWRYKYKYGAKEKILSLGVYPTVTLADARDKHREAKQLLDKNIDPKEARKQQEEQIIRDQENTFELVARAWYEKKKAGWKETHATKVWRRVEMHVLPMLGKRPIRHISSEEVIKCIERIEASGANDIARRALQTIKDIFKHAAIRNMCERNSIWDLEPKYIIAPKQEKNNPYLEAKEIPELIYKIDRYKGDYRTVMALKLTLLFIVRSNEIRGARWEEFDFEEKLWRVPVRRMKKGRIHFVPLSTQAVELLEELRAVTGIYPTLFPQNVRRDRETNEDKYMSDGTLSKALRMMGYRDKLTPHGMRGTASTILHEKGFNTEYIERQLAHLEENKVKAAYNHAEYLPQRREMMQWWGNFLEECGLCQKMPLTA